LVDRKGIARNTTCFCSSRPLTLWSFSSMNIFTLWHSSHYKKSLFLSCPSWLKIWSIRLIPKVTCLFSLLQLNKMTFWTTWSNVTFN
jgi:hypothetical protein